VKRVLICTTLLLATSSAAPHAVDEPDILPAPKAGFTFQYKGVRPSLAELMEQYQRVAGVQLIAAVREPIGPLKFDAGPGKSVELPRETVQERVETMLADAGYCLTLVHADEPVVLAVKRMPRSPASTGAVYVEPDQLESVAKHPALLCWTILELPHVGTHALDAELAKGWDTSVTIAHFTLGGSGRRLLMGPGKAVAERARVLLELDDAERAKAEAARTPDGGSKK
jgi:hypothetical protein